MTDDRKAALVLAPAAEAPRRARRFLSATLVGWDRVDLADRALLAVSELVTNAFLHGDGDIKLIIDLGDALRVEVHDASSQQPALRRYSPLSTTGRGLHLVEHLVDRWGTDEQEDAGKLVWFELDARPVEKAGGLVSGRAMTGAAPSRTAPEQAAAPDSRADTYHAPAA